MQRKKTLDGEKVYQWGMLFVAIWFALFLGGCAWGWLLKFG